MEIPFNGTYMKQRVFEVLRALSDATKKKNYFANGLYGIYFTGFIIFGVLFLLGKTSSTINSSRMIRMAFTLVFLTYFIFREQINYWIKVHQIWKGLQKSPSEKGYVSDLGITLVSGSGDEYQFLWKIFIRKVVLSDVLALLDTDGTVLILQRNFFESDRDWKRVTDTVMYKVREITNV